MSSSRRRPVALVLGRPIALARRMGPAATRRGGARAALVRPPRIPIGGPRRPVLSSLRPTAGPTGTTRSRRFWPIRRSARLRRARLALFEIASLGMQAESRTSIIEARTAPAVGWAWPGRTSRLPRPARSWPAGPWPLRVRAGRSRPERSRPERSRPERSRSTVTRPASPAARSLGVALSSASRPTAAGSCASRMSPTSALRASTARSSAARPGPATRGIPVAGPISHESPRPAVASAGRPACPRRRSRDGRAHPSVDPTRPSHAPRGRRRAPR
jgi:hypothetical protein